MKMRLLPLLLLALPLMVYAQETRPPENIITVTGTAQVFADPDEATVQLGVVEQATNAAEAQDKANRVVTTLLQRLNGLGIPKERIQSSRITLSPIYDYPQNQAPRIRGYQAQNTLTVRLTDFALIGKVIDAGTQSGVNNIEGVAFGLRNSRGPRSEAYKEAVADARSKADAIVQALGMRIVGVYDVQTDGGYVPPRPMSLGRGADMMEAKVATPVEPGQMELSVTVTIRYRIN